MSEYLKYLKNKKLLQDNLAYDPSTEHDACGVGLIAQQMEKNQEKLLNME